MTRQNLRSLMLFAVLIAGITACRFILPLPDVAGTYAGTLQVSTTILVDGNTVTLPTTVDVAFVVTQDEEHKEHVTISTAAPGTGSGLQEVMTGTLDHDGVFTPDPDEQRTTGFEPDPVCGELLSNTISVVFKKDSMTWNIQFSTEQCGSTRITGTLSDTES